MSHAHTVIKSEARLMAVSFQARSERGGGCRDKPSGGARSLPFLWRNRTHTLTHTHRLKWHSETNQQPAPSQNLYCSPCPQLTLSKSFSQPPSARPYPSSTWQGLLPRGHISLDYTGTLAVACSCQSGPASQIHTQRTTVSLRVREREWEGGTTQAYGKSAGRMIH